MRNRLLLLFKCDEYRSHSLSLYLSLYQDDATSSYGGVNPERDLRYLLLLKKIQGAEWPRFDACVERWGVSDGLAKARRGADKDHEKLVKAFSQANV